MNTEAFDILLIDLERTLRRLDDIDVLDCHYDKMFARKKERIEQATLDAQAIEECKADLENILDVMQQLKAAAA